MATLYADRYPVFYETYRMYRNYLGYTEPYSYRQWMRLPDNHKVAALYVQFYREITLAWSKVLTKWSIEEEGVETINQYLTKNAEKIKLDKKRFTPQYIYKVARMCLYCVCIDPTPTKQRYMNETPETFNVGEDEVSWFDLLGTASDFQESVEAEELRDFIDSLEDELPFFVEHILGEKTDTQIVRELKNAGYISGSTTNKEYRQYVLDYLDKLGSAKLKVKVNQFFGDVENVYVS